MITYEAADSSFYVANKNYCEAIEGEFTAINLDCAGFCNSFGYEIETTLIKNNLTCNFRFFKHQSTQNRGFNAVDYAGTELTINGIDKNLRVSAGKSFFKRFFCSNKIKAEILKPYFIKSNKQQDIFRFNLIKLIQDNNISELKIRQGKLDCKIHDPIAKPLKLMSDIEYILDVS